MERLANLTEADIQNGVLNHLLVEAGISNVPEYVNQFHQDTEDLIVEKFEHLDPNKEDNDEQIAPPADIRRWLSGLPPHLGDPTQPSLPQQQKQAQPQQTKNAPADLKSWMHSMAPGSSEQPTGTTSAETATPVDDNPTAAVDGNLGSWLNGWSKSLAEQPPPASLDSWLQRMVPDNMHESIGKANSSKTRLNSYLSAAQEVLSQHGYNVSTEIKPTAVATKTGMFGNVKQMYFLWKVLDKNNDRKITVEDVQIMLQEMGFGFLSKVAAQSLFDMVDANHDGELQFRDFIALMGIIKQLVGAVGSAKA